LYANKDKLSIGAKLLTNKERDKQTKIRRRKNNRQKYGQRNDIKKVCRITQLLFFVRRRPCLRLKL